MNQKNRNLKEIKMADVLSVIADVLKQDKQQKREHNKVMKEVQKKLKEKGSEEVAEEEGDKEDYMKFFAGKLKKYGVKSPAELDDEKKKKFFNEIEKDWTHDSNEEKETTLGDRVKSRLKAEQEDDNKVTAEVPAEEDEDEDPVGDSDVVQGGEPSEEELEKLADLVVQKIKDKADEEEEEEEEPEATEAESGKKEKIEINPKMESVRNPHARNTWEEALRQVYKGVEIKEASDTSWIDSHAKKIESKWKSMNKSARKKWLSKMSDMAAGKKTKQEILDDVLDDYGLIEAYTDLSGSGGEGTTTSDTDKDYGLHRFSDPKYVPAYTDKSFQTTPDKTGIGKNVKTTQSGTPNKAKGKATAAKKSLKVDPKTGEDKIPVPTKSDTPDKAVGKATAAKISPEVTVKAGVSTAIHNEEVDKVLEYHRTQTEKRSVAFARKFYQKGEK